MPLESLSSEQFNIHDLTLEQEKQSELSPSKLYESLKSSTFYDKGTDLWHESIRAEGLEQTNRNVSVSDCYTQLLGVLCEYQVNPPNAKNIYEKLETLDFYSDNEMWHERNDPNSDFNTNAQLAGVLCAHLFDSHKATEIYRNLKVSPLFNNDTKEWNEALDLEGEIKFTDTNTEDQLLGVLCENLFDHQEAARIYEKLKSGNLYVKETGQWDSIVLIDKEEVEIDSNVQLLGILCEHLFDEDSSKEEFIKCKKSVLYNNNLRLWNHQMNLEGNLDIASTQVYYTKDQLLGILCELLLKNSTIDLDKPIPRLTEQRSY